MAEAHRRSPARGVGWPLTTKDLRAALGDVFDRVDLDWHDSPQSPEIVWATWRPHEERAGAGPTGAVAALWVFAVATDQETAVRAVLLEQVLPDLREWLTAALAAPADWQSRTHAVRWVLQEGDVVRHTYDASRRHGRRT